MTTYRALILAGGPATRLGALSEGKPKPMLEVGGRPFLLRTLDELEEFGVRDVFIACGAFEKFYAENLGPTYGSLRITLIPEDERLETGGAVANAFTSIPGDDPVFVLNGDDFCPGAIRAMAEAGEPGAAGVLTVAEAPDAGEFETVDVGEGGWIRAMRRRSGLSEPGLYHAGWDLFFPREIRPLLPAEKVWKLEAGLTGPHAEKFKAVRCARHIEIGRPETLAAARAEG